MFNFDPMMVQAETDYRAERMRGSRVVRRNRTRTAQSHGSCRLHPNSNHPI